MTRPARAVSCLLLALPLLGAPLRAQQLDVARILRDVSVLAHDSMEGRAAATGGGERARRALVGMLERAGLEPVGPSYEHPFELGARRGVNVIARVEGRAPDAPVIVLSAHYDHVGVRAEEIYNGADDNASGVAVALEMARVVRESPLRHPVLLLLADAEESGLAGARAFVADPPLPLERIALNVNLDMVARTDGTLWAAGAHPTPALEPVLRAVAEVAPLSLRLGHDRPGAPEGADWTGSSDHGAFHQAGIPFVYFGVEDHADYHRPTDDVERIVHEELAASAATILVALRALDDALPTILGHQR